MAKETETRSAEREALAAAIANVARTEADLQTARDAADKACDRLWRAQARLAELRERPDNSSADIAAAVIRDAGRRRTFHARESS